MVPLHALFAFCVLYSPMFEHHHFASAFVLVTRYGGCRFAFLYFHSLARAIPGICRFLNLHHFMRSFCTAWFILYTLVLLVSRVRCVCLVYCCLSRYYQTVNSGFISTYTPVRCRSFGRCTNLQGISRCFGLLGYSVLMSGRGTVPTKTKWLVKFFIVPIHGFLRFSNLVSALNVVTQSIPNSYVIKFTMNEGQFMHLRGFQGLSGYAQLMIR